jgi:hypothetical protein
VISLVKGLGDVIRVKSARGLELAVFLYESSHADGPVVHGVRVDEGVLQCCLDIPQGFDFGNLQPSHIVEVDLLLTDRALLSRTFGIAQFREVFSGAWVCAYDELLTWHWATVDEICRLGLSSNAKILLVGKASSLPALLLNLKVLGFLQIDCCVLDDGDHDFQGFGSKLRSKSEVSMSVYDVIVVTSNQETVLHEQDAFMFPFQTIFVDAGLSSFSGTLVDVLYAKGSKILRIDNSAGRAAYLYREIESRRLHLERRGTFKVRGVQVVAGGHLGPRGSVIVDNISNPNHVIGVADGSGRTIYDFKDTDFERDVLLVERYITER